MEFLRQTKTTCPVCLRELPGQVVIHDQAAWLERECPEHGPASARLSRHPEYFRELHSYYFDLMRESFPQHDFIIRATDRCNLDCPICLAAANDREVPDLSADRLRQFLTGRKRHKIDLMGAEPTVREDLEELVRLVAQSGNYAALHTNGLRLAEPEYLSRLKRAGLTEVHFQFDGFSEATYQALRGRPLLDLKQRALDNLEKLDMATDLKCTVARGVNTDNLAEVLEFAVRHDFVREVFYLGCRSLGRQREGDPAMLLAPDELIDLLEEQTRGRINRDDLRIFQKLYFALLHIARLRKCFYNQHYLLVRRPEGGYETIFKVIRKDGLEQKLDDFRRDTRGGTRRWRPTIKFIWRIIPHFLSWRALRFVKDALALKLLMFFGFALGRVPRRNLLLGFITACDPLIWDAAVAANCGKGELAMDIGQHDSGATANIERERTLRGLAD